jgi:hypothetical protein
MLRRSALIAACLLAVGAVIAACRHAVVALSLPHRSAEAHATRAERSFFRSLVYNAEPRSAVRPLLDEALAMPSPDPYAYLYDGMFDLWRAGEESLDPTTERTVLVAARDALTRYRAVVPDDGRVASWLEGATFRIARIDHDEATQRDAIARLEDAHDRDAPHRLFHNLTLALMLFHEPAPSERCPDFGIHRALAVDDAGTPSAVTSCRTVEPLFCRGLCYLAENARGCRRSDGCRMSLLWPHTLSGFLTVTADYHLKANDIDGALRILRFVRAASELAPFHYLVVDRLLRPEEYAASFRDPAYPAPGRPHMIMDTPEVACRLCHLSEQADRLSFVAARPQP